MHLLRRLVLVCLSNNPGKNTIKQYLIQLLHEAPPHTHARPSQWQTDGQTFRKVLKADSNCEIAC